MERGLLHNREEFQERYLDPREDPFVFFVIPILKLMPRKELARAVGVKERFIQFIRNGKKQASRETQNKLTHLAAVCARFKMEGLRNADDLVACIAYAILILEKAV